MSEAGIGAAPAWALALLRDARVGRLATADAAGRPLVVPVCYVFDGARCYSAVDAKPKSTRNLRRLRNIADNPQVSLVVDVWDEDWSRLCWVIVEGRAEILTAGAEFTGAVDRLVAKYPQYRDLPLDRGDGAVVALTPGRVLSWRMPPRSPAPASIDAAGIDDAGLVLAAMRRGFEQYRGSLEPPSSALDETEDDVRAAMARGGAFVARDGGVVVGSARYQLRGDHTYAERVAVDPGYRGRGIGAALMRAIEDAARAAGHAEVRIGVRASLPANLRFYEELGYRVRSSRRHPRGPDYDMTLTKDLRGPSTASP